MQTQKHIRVIALGLVFDGDRVFVFEDYESLRQRYFYRALGGGVEFGESCLDALKREFLEEIQAELTNIHYLGCIENRFTFLGESKHEIVQLYRCDFADPKFYQIEELSFFDGSQQPIVAKWVHRDRFKSGELWLVPEECLNYL